MEDQSQDTLNSILISVLQSRLTSLMQINDAVEGIRKAVGDSQLDPNIELGLRQIEDVLRETLTVSLSITPQNDSGESDK